MINHLKLLFLYILFSTNLLYPGDFLVYATTNHPQKKTRSEIINRIIQVRNSNDHKTEDVKNSKEDIENSETESKSSDNFKDKPENPSTQPTEKKPPVPPEKNKMGKKSSPETEKEKSSSDTDAENTKKIQGSVLDKVRQIHMLSKHLQLKAKIEKADIPPHVRQIALDEYEKMEGLQSNPSYHYSRTYIEEWLLKLPWNSSSTECENINKIVNSINESHIGQPDLKERLRSYFASRIFRNVRYKNLSKDTMAGSKSIEHKNTRGTILCLVGAPGTGKTSIARKIAQAINREYIKISFGSIRKANHLVGFLKSYSGAEPGIIIKRLRSCKKNNPVILIDEVDKTKGDDNDSESTQILDTLLEILDPNENSHFTDHYIDIPFDLSNTLFICTANHVSGIPAPLLDRMEIIEIPSYTTEEKIEIAKECMIPRIIESYYLKQDEILISDEIIQLIIEEYTTEKGVRGLEKKLIFLIEKILSDYFFDKDGNVSSSSSVLVTEELIHDTFNSTQDIDKEDHWRHLYT